MTKSKKKKMEEFEEEFKELKNDTINVAKYILQKANNDTKVPVVLLAMATLEVHKYMALVLAPMCPKAFKAQVKALSKTLDKVLDYLHDSTYNQDARAYFTNLVLARLNNFIEFMALCYGTSTRIVVMEEGDGEVLDGFHTVIKDVFAPTIRFEDLRPDEDVLVDVPYDMFMERFLGDQTKVFTKYYGKLFDYINQKANGDKGLPAALQAYAFAHLYDSLNLVLPNDCKIRYAVHFRAPPIDTVVDLGFSPGDVWFMFFLEHVAWCYGIELKLKVGLGPEDKVEVEKVVYHLYQDAPTS
jgi:hypothetical protein